MNINHTTRLIIITSISLLLSACPAFVDDFFEGELRIFNADTTNNITSISVTEDCSKGWEVPFTVNLAPGQEVTYDYDADRYDVRVCYGAGTSCYIEADVKVKPDDTKSVIATDSGQQPEWCF